MMVLSLSNLVIYSAQVLMVVAAATIGVRFVGTSAPRPRLAFWRAVVAVCLLLPLWPVRRVDFIPASTATIGVETGDLEAHATGLSSTGAISIVPWLLLSGMVARGAWLGLGVMRLRQLRTRSVPATLDDQVDALAPHAELRWSEQVDQPMTFGLWRPVVLLPPRLTDLSPEVQRAAVCHELVHVSRHDWAWRLVEEAVQTVFWFHPAMWWALGQVQLSREETVDQLVVAMTGARRPYMNALMTFAEARPTLASAIPYVRRRHLAARLKRLSQETIMSPARLALTGAALVVVVLAASLGAVSSLPLHSSTPAPTVIAAGQAEPVSAERRLKPRSRESLTITFINAPLRRILSIIGTDAGITIRYDRDVQDPPVTIQLAGVTLEQALDQLLSMNHLSYRVMNERAIRIVRQVQ